MNEHVIDEENHTFRYGDLAVVDPIDFQVAVGWIFDFLGPNGAGKSTTVNMLTDLLRPKEGRAIILDIDIASNPKLVQAQIDVCFEITNLYEQMSAVDNVKLFARLFGVRDFDAGALLKRVGLAAREHNLSSASRWE